HVDVHEVRPAAGNGTRQCVESTHVELAVDARKGFDRHAERARAVLERRHPRSRGQQPWLDHTAGSAKELLQVDLRAAEGGRVDDVGHAHRRPGSRAHQPAAGPGTRAVQSRLRSPWIQESEISPSTMQSSRSVPSRTKPSFSSTRAEAALRVSVSACTRLRSSVSNAHCSKARTASVAYP